MLPVRSILIGVALLLPEAAAARDALLSHFEGKWGTPGSIASCDENSATIRFSSNGNEMRISYSKPVEGPGEVMATDFHYEVVGVAGNSVRMNLFGETRSTEAGELVVWDLVRLSEDAYCWHRADWKPGLCTPPRLRCSSILDDFEALMRQRTTDALELMRRGEFEEAASLFKLPPVIPETERDSEYRRLANSLAVVVRELGNPEDWFEAMQDQRNPRKLVNVSIGPSHVVVSQEHGTFFFAFFQVRFEHEASGFYRAAFGPAGEILQMTFSLPREHSERMAEIGAILLKETGHEL